MPLALSDIGDLVTDPYLVAIVVYLLALVGVGVYKTKAVKNSEDFMVAGRSLPWYILVGTLLATWIGSGSLFSGAGLGYRNGLAGLWSSGGAWVGIVLVFFIARRVRNFGKVTIPDIFQARYGPTAAVLATITTVIAYMTIVSYQFLGGGKVLSTVTEGAVPMDAGIVITAVFAVTYTVLAGMYSVVYTDVVNGVLMTLGTLGALVYLVFQVGGVDEVMAAAEAAGKWSVFGHWADERTTSVSGPIIAISFFVPTMLLLMGDANMYQRIFSARDGGSARKAVFFWVIGVVVLESAVSMIGLTGSVAAEQGILPDLVGQAKEAYTTSMATKGEVVTADNLLKAGKSGSESVIPAIALSFNSGFPLVLGMLLVATMMAIIVSTADSFLLIPATNLTRDVFQRMHKGASERSVLLVSRVLVLALGVIAYLLSSAFTTVLDAAFVAYNIYGASIAPALLAAFLWKRATKTGAVASIVTGASVTLLYQYVLQDMESFSSWHPFLQELTYPAAGLSVTALIVGSLVTPAPPREVWGQFFDEDGSGAKPARKPQTTSVHTLAEESLDGAAHPLSAYHGKVTLVVNVASECGYTPQYAGLQALQTRLEERGFSVLGFPSNEFGGQEPGGPASILDFCDTNYGITFPLLAKGKTKPGPGQSPLYQVLGEATGELPKWNFCKYLVGRDGTVLGFYPSDTAPDDPGLVADIERALGS